MIRELGVVKVEVGMKAVTIFVSRAKPKRGGENLNH